MPNQKRILTDPAYAEHVSRVLERHYNGETARAIAEAMGDTHDTVKDMIRTYGDRDQKRERGADWLLDTRKMTVMAAAGFSTAQIAKTFGKPVSNVQSRLEALQPEIDRVARTWRSDSLEAGFASREYRIWQLAEDLAYFEEPIVKIEYLKEGTGYTREVLDETIPRKFETDMYGRPIWTVYRDRLFREIAALKGDHSSTINLGFNDATQKMLDRINQPRLPEPAVDVASRTLEENDAS